MRPVCLVTTVDGDRVCEELLPSVKTSDTLIELNG
jgi:hypothetical protein